MGSPRSGCRLTWTLHPCSTASTSGCPLTPWSSVPGSCNGSSPPASAPRTLTTRALSGSALDPDDPAPKPDPARPAQIEAQSGELPVAVLGLFGDRTTQVPTGDVPGEDQHAILVLRHGVPILAQNPVPSSHDRRPACRARQPGRFPRKTPRSLRLAQGGERPDRRRRLPGRRPLLREL